MKQTKLVTTRVTDRSCRFACDYNYVARIVFSCSYYFIHLDKIQYYNIDYKIIIKCTIGKYTVRLNIVLSFAVLNSRVKNRQLAVLTHGWVS